MGSRSPTMWMHFRQTMGRVFRETGQALDRVGLRGQTHATMTRIMGDDPSIFDDHLSRHRHLMPMLKHGRPMISSDTAFLAPCSTLIGTVHVGPGSSIWYGAILRADNCDNGRNWKNQETQEPWEIDNENIYEESFGGGIFIGENSNVQDGCIVTAREHHTVIGNGVTIGHSAQIHSATVEDFSLIGMGSVLKKFATVETEGFVAAGAVVGQGETVKAGELWVGNPARKLRDLTPQERTKLHYQSDEYVKVAKNQSGIENLGGNIPKSLLQYTMLGAAHAEEPQMMEREAPEIVEREKQAEMEPLKVAS